MSRFFSVHPASCTMGTGSLSTGVKRPECGADHPPPSREEVEGRVELYLYFPSLPLLASCGGGAPPPQLANRGKEGKYRYNSTLPSTSSLEGGGWSAPHSGRFTPPLRDPVPIVQEAGCTLKNRDIHSVNTSCLINVPFLGHGGGQLLPCSGKPHCSLPEPLLEFKG